MPTLEVVDVPKLLPYGWVIEFIGTNTLVGHSGLGSQKLLLPADICYLSRYSKVEISPMPAEVAYPEHTRKLLEVNR